MYHFFVYCTVALNAFSLLCHDHRSLSIDLTILGAPPISGILKICISVACVISLQNVLEVHLVAIVALGCVIRLQGRQW